MALDSKHWRYGVEKKSRKPQLFATVGFEATSPKEEDYRHRRITAQPEQNKRNDVKQRETTRNNSQ